MDKKKKEKIVAMTISALLSLAVSIVACILGIAPENMPAVSQNQNLQSAVYSITI